MILNHTRNFHWKELCWIHKQVSQLSKENVHSLISHWINLGSITRSVRIHINCKVVSQRETSLQSWLASKLGRICGRTVNTEPWNQTKNAPVHVVSVLKILVYTVNTNILSVIFTEILMYVECYKTYNKMK